MSAVLSERWAMLSSKPFMAMADNVERRKHRRHDLEMLDITVEKVAGSASESLLFGTIVNLSAGGICIKSAKPGVQVGAQVRVKLDLPNSMGISPFIDHEHDGKPATQWSGWMHVTRVHCRKDGLYDVAGRLMDMNDVDRGMLGLYLSTQPLAA